MAVLTISRRVVEEVTSGSAVIKRKNTVAYRIPHRIRRKMDGEASGSVTTEQILAKREGIRRDTDWLREARRG